MSEPRRPRRFIALAATYLVALQALQLPLAVAVGGVPDFILCSAAASAASTQSPASHQTGCPCAAGCGMQCCVHALAGPPQSVFAVEFRLSGLRMVPPVLAPVIRRAVRYAQFARGPPSA